MNAYKLAMLHNCLLKSKPLNNLKSSIFWTELQNFSLATTVFNNLIDRNSFELLISGKENIINLETFSKKKNKLSVVEEKDLETVNSLKKGNIFYPYKDPMDRFKSIMKEDLKKTGNNLLQFFTNVKVNYAEPVYFKRYTDILIIGGGPVGLSVAYSLKKQFPHGPKVLIVDKDNSFPHTSTNLGQSMVTYQFFNDETEILALKYGAEFFSSFFRHTRINGMPSFNLPYDPLGSLILADNENAEEVLKKHNLLKNYGIKNKILKNTVLKEKFPWLNSDNILFGSLGILNEGTVDPWSYLVGIKSKCINLGVDFETAEVVDFGFHTNMVRRVICKLPDGSYNSIEFGICVIAGGIESLNLVNLLNNSDNFNLNLKLPLEERLRYEYFFYNPNIPKLNLPIVINSDKTYIRRQGISGHYVLGVPSVVNNDNEESKPYYVFQNKIEPFLRKKFYDFDKIDLIQGWSDVYDFCFSNQVGITGPHPETKKIVFALGFSEHGFQLLPALGRAVMEYIFYDEYQTLDFTPFHIENLWRKQHLEAQKQKRELLKSEKHVAYLNN